MDVTPAEWYVVISNGGPGLPGAGYRLLSMACLRIFRFEPFV